MSNSVKNNFMSLFFFLAFLIITWFVAQNLISNDIFGFSFRGEEVDPIFFVLVASFTFLGLILGTFYQELKSKKANRLPWWRIVFKSLSSVRFGLALLISPIIVLIVFNQVYDQDYNFTIFVFCFQNGFFWERTLSAISD